MFTRLHNQKTLFLFQHFLVIVMLLALTGASSWAQTTWAQTTIKVACVGDSITAGHGLVNPAQDSYPSRLALLLGRGWQVRNFGVSSTTAIENSNFPYVKQRAFQEALAYKADVVLIGLGSNDTKPENISSLSTQFEPSYRALIARFREANPNARIYAFLPTPVFPTAFGITDRVLTAQVIPFIRNVATQTGVPTIDLHSALAGKRYCFPDCLHPNEEGSLRIARTVYRELTGTEPPPIRKPTSGISIMPMGDTITVGATDPFVNGGGSGYRDQLYARLKNSGLDFQFVGSAITGASATLRAAGQDFHEGHPSYKLIDLLNNLEANLSDVRATSNGGYWFNGGNNTDRDAVSPDIVLLLAGTSDILAKTTATTMQERMTALLKWFAANRPNTRVFVGTLIPFDDAVRKTSGVNDKVRTFNEWLKQAIPANTSGNCTLVDQYALFVDAQGTLKTQDSPDGIYLSDGAHPSHNGYVAMGDAWFKAIRPSLGSPEAPSLLVNSLDDVEDVYDDRTTLREAITYANTLGATDSASEVPTIGFDAQAFRGKRTITLNGTPLPEITNSLIIAGSKAGVTIDGGGKSNILTSSGSQVALKALTFANGLNQSVQNTAGTLSVEGCTFVGNAGAVVSNATTDPATSLSLRNSTLTGNEVAVSSQGSATLTISNCTIVGNGVGLHNEEGVGSFTVTNSLLTGNTQADTDAALASNTFNLIGGDAGLDPSGLKNNGGPTDTIALLLTSPALNAGAPPASGNPNSEASSAQTDQRGGGYARVRSGRLDIGAFEVQNLPPTATDDAFSTPEDIPLVLDAAHGILANDFDPDGQETLRVKPITSPQHGKLSLSSTGALTYSPDLNWNGTDSFTYFLSDGVFSAQATTTITVVPVNDAPTATVWLTPSSLPTTNALLRATAVGTDVEGDAVSLTYEWTKGTTVLRGENGPTLDLSKAGNGDKGDKISVTVIPSDDQSSGTGATATVTIANTAPTLFSSTFEGKENQVLSGRLVAQDPDQEILLYSLVRAPRFGTLALQSNGAFTYTTRSNWNGSDSFSARVTDGSGAIAVATFTTNTAPVNGAPLAQNDTVKGVEDTPLSIPASDLLRNDSNGEAAGEVDALRIVKVAAPSDFPGTVSLDATRQKVLFTPAPNWNGTSRFSYTVQDSGLATSTATVTLQILPVNDAPVAQGGNLTVLSGTWGELPLTGSDVEGDALTFALAGKPSGGIAQVVKVGAQWLLRYQSKVGFTGTDTLSIVARDGKLNSPPATIAVTVQPNSAPQLLSVSPNRGSMAAGSTLIFEQKVRDANGADHLDAIALLVGNLPSAPNARGGATLWFDAIANQFTLTKDDGVGTFAPVALGRTLENTQVKVSLGVGDVVRDNYGNLTLKWRITFKPTFTGPKSLWGRAEDLGGLSAGFSKQGDITLTTPSPAPRPTSSAPTS